MEINVKRIFFKTEGDTKNIPHFELEDGTIMVPYNMGCLVEWIKINNK